MQKKFTGLHIELTNQCNLRCTHCYNIEYLESNNTDIDTNEVKKIIDDALLAGVRDIGFSGGEPFMRSDIFELITYSSKHPIHILTNGMFINKRVIEKLKQIPNLLIEFRVSLDGLKTHAKIRGTSFQPALNGIKLLLEAGYVTSVNTMITNDNISDLMAMYDLFKKLEVDRWRLGFIFGQGNAAQNPLTFDCTEQQLEMLKDLIIRHKSEKPIFELDISKLYRSGIFDGAHLIGYDYNSKPCSYQGALTVRPNGDVCYCPSLDMVYGNLKEQSMTTILDNPEWLKVYDFQVNQLPQKCQECEFLRECGGGCRADSYYDTGDFYSYSEMICKLVAYYVKNIMPILADDLNDLFII